MHRLVEPHRQLRHRLLHSVVVARLFHGVVDNQLAALDRLEERVVKFPCQACPFCEALIEAGIDSSGDLSCPQSVKCPHDEGTEKSTENPEPVSLEPCRWDVEIQARAFFVPDAVVITRDHPETVAAWAEII